MSTIIQTTSPAVSGDVVRRLLLLGAGSTFIGTYCIIANWIYAGYVDLWHGVYGLGDDDDDD